MQMQSVNAAAKVARRLHKQHMGHRYIEIFEVSYIVKDVCSKLATVEPA